MRFNIIGAGRLGKNLGLALVEKKLGHLAAVYNRNLPSAESAVQQIGAGSAVASLKALPAVELTFITTPDDIIGHIAAGLAKEQVLIPGSIVVHCSGALSSAELQVLKKQGCFIANFHPPKAFRQGHLNSEIFKDCVCIVEGDKKAVDLLLAIFEPLGAILVPISADKKTLYHSATVFSANYLVTLAATSVELLIKAGVPQNMAQTIGTQLIHSSLVNIEQATTLSQALTGPLARGDSQTIRKHLAVLHEPALNALYRAAAIATLPLTNLDTDKKIMLQQLLAANEED